MTEQTLPTYAHELPQAQRLWYGVRKFRLDTGYTAPCMEWFPCVVLPSDDGQRLTLYFVRDYTPDGIRLDTDQRPVTLDADDRQTRDLSLLVRAVWTYTLKAYDGDNCETDITAIHRFFWGYIPVLHGYKQFYETSVQRIRRVLHPLTSGEVGMTYTIKDKIETFEVDL